MEDMISRNDAYNTLTEYYHHTTEIQHKALREALERVPNSQPELIEREAYIRGFEQGKTQGRLDALSAQPETHDKRTETHACDLISRQAAMEEISKQQTYKMFEGEDTLYLDANDVGSVLASLPSAQPDMSEYSDKLWQKAYERGKAEAQAEIIRCKDCKYWREHKYAKETKRYIPFCGLNAIYTKSDDFCNRAERRTDG